MGKAVAIAVLLGWFWGSMPCACAQQLSPAPTPTPVTNAVNDTLLGQVSKLIRGHSSEDVIVAFIRQWPTPYLTSADDLDHLRQAGAGPRVVQAYAQRGAQLRLRAHRSAEASSANVPSVMFVPVSRTAPQLGPESSGGTPYIFSDALWWWANYYPYPFPYYGWGWAGGGGYWGARRW